MTSPHPKLACEIFIRKGDKLLMGLRKNCYGSGTWALPGGHVEYNERLVETICREVKEELGADITPADLTLVSIIDDLTPNEDRHYVHVTFELLDPKFEPRLMEPEFCEEWRYFAIDALPKELYRPHQDILKNYFTDRKMYNL